MLPKEVRDELERRIAERAFAGYEELAGWLQQQGYEIGEHSVQHYGAKLSQKMESLKTSALHAQAIAHIAPEDRDTIIEAMIDLLNDRVFEALIQAKQLEHAEMARLTHMVGELTRLRMARQSWLHENSPLLTREQQALQERRAKTRNAEAFATVRTVLDAVKSFKTEMTRTEADDPEVSPAELTHTKKS